MGPPNFHWFPMVWGWVIKLIVGVCRTYDKDSLFKVEWPFPKKRSLDPGTYKVTCAWSWYSLGRPPTQQQSPPGLCKCLVGNYHEPSLDPQKKNSDPFHYTGSLTGIPYHCLKNNPYITGWYNPLYNPTNQGIFVWLTCHFYCKKGAAQHLHRQVSYAVYLYMSPLPSSNPMTVHLLYCIQIC